MQHPLADLRHAAPEALNLRRVGIVDNGAHLSGSVGILHHLPHDHLAKRGIGEGLQRNDLRDQGAVSVGVMDVEAVSHPWPLA